MLFLYYVHFTPPSLPKEKSNQELREIIITPIPQPFSTIPAYLSTQMSNQQIGGEKSFPPPSLLILW